MWFTANSLPTLYTSPSKSSVHHNMYSPVAGTPSSEAASTTFSRGVPSSQLPILKDRWCKVWIMLHFKQLKQRLQPSRYLSQVWVKSHLSEQRLQRTRIIWVCSDIWVYQFHITDFSQTCELFAKSANFNKKMPDTVFLPWWNTKAFETEQ